MADHLRLIPALPSLQPERARARATISEKKLLYSIQEKISSTNLAAAAVAVVAAVAVGMNEG